MSAALLGIKYGITPIQHARSDAKLFPQRPTRNPNQLKLTDEEMVALRSKFLLIDVENDGKINATNLARFYHQVGVYSSPNEEEAAAFLASLNVREVNYKQFLIHHERIFEKVPEATLNQLLGKENKPKAPVDIIAESNRINQASVSARGPAATRPATPSKPIGTFSAPSKKDTDHAAIAETSKQLEELRHQIAAAQQELKALEERKGHELALQKQQTDLEAALHQVEAQLAAKQNELKHVEEQIAKANAVLAETTARTSKAIEDAEFQLKGLSDLIHARKEELAQLDQQIQAKEDKLAKLTAEPEMQEAQPDKIAVTSTTDQASSAQAIKIGQYANVLHMLPPKAYPAEPTNDASERAHGDLTTSEDSDKEKNDDKEPIEKKKKKKSKTIAVDKHKDSPSKHTKSKKDKKHKQQESGKDSKKDEIGDVATKSSEDSSEGHHAPPQPQPDESMEQLDDNLLSQLASRMAALIDTLPPFAGFLDPHYTEMLPNCQRIITAISANHGVAKFPIAEKELISVQLSNTRLKVEQCHRILQDYQALIGASTQLKGQIYKYICEIHNSVKAILENVEMRVKIVTETDELTEELLPDSQVREQLLRYFARDKVLLRWELFRQSTATLFSENHFKILQYLLDPWNTNYVSYKRLIGFVKEFGPVRTALIRLNELMAHPAFQGYLSDNEVNSILVAFGDGTWLLTLNKARLKAQISWLQNSAVYTGRITYSRAAMTCSIEFPPNGPQFPDLSGKSFNSLTQLLEAFIPRIPNPQPFMCKFAQKSWYHGDITSDESQRLLIPGGDGSFLFRLSSKKGYLAISYVFREKVGHTLIKFNQTDQYENGSNIYNGLESLLQQHSQIFRYVLDSRSFTRRDTGMLHDMMHNDWFSQALTGLILVGVNLQLSQSYFGRERYIL